MLQVTKNNNVKYEKTRDIVEEVIDALAYARLLGDVGNLDDCKDYYTNELMKGVNEFLFSICSSSDNDYKRGIIISTLVKNGINLDIISDKIKYDCVRRSHVFEAKKGNDDWECIVEESTWSVRDDEYKHHNVYCLYLNVDNYDGTLDELVGVLSRCKKLGYIYILVTKKQRISSKLREATYGVIKFNK